MDRDPPLAPGAVVADRFEIAHIAGEGGMGTVYRAKDRATGRDVAVKVLRASAQASAARFLREARVLEGLAHPAIVRYVAHGEMNTGGLFLAMEWLDGEDVQAHLAAGGFTVDESVRLTRTIADALGVAHARGVVHRDVKPSNVFLVGGDVANARILDFGVAHVHGDMHEATVTGMLIGTLGYMAPEQARGSAVLEAPADVFALGCVLYECLTGRRAFDGELPTVVLAKILFEDVVPLRELCPTVPRALDSLVRRMLEKDPERRPRGGAIVASELASLGPLEGFGATSVAYSRPVLTEREQRVVSVVIVARDARPEHAYEQTMDAPIKSGAFVPTETLGMQLESLVDGSIVATLTGGGSATDRAAKAARCALALRKQHPRSRMVLATGRGEWSGRIPLGDVLDRASQLLRHAPVDVADRAAIRLDDVSAGLLDGRFDVRGDPVGLLLHGERDVRDVARLLLGRAMPCIGRERELTMLAATLRECEEEPVARCVLVTAEAGIGKSRVRVELERSLREGKHPIELWFGRGDPTTVGAPFAILAPALRLSAGLEGGEPLETARKKLRARVARSVPEGDQTRVTEFLGEVVGVAFDGGPELRAARADALLLGDQIRRAWEDFVAAECRSQTVLILLEDLHWGDLPSVKLIDAALRRLKDEPLMVVAFARPEVHDLFPKLWADRGLSEVRLAGLTRRSAERIAHEALGTKATPERVARVVRRAAGNALYLEELLRAEADGRDTAPDSVIAMVQARLEVLAPEARRVLRAASVFGQSFTTGGLALLLGGEEAVVDVQSWLDHLVEREIISLSGDAAGEAGKAYAFCHALVRDSAYSMLTDTDRALGHALAGEWLLSQGSTNAVVLAEHFELGGNRERAIDLYAQAAEQALAANDFAMAITRAARSRACGATLGSLARAELILAEAHMWHGAADAALAHATEAIHLSVVGSELWYRAMAEALLAAGRSQGGDVVARLSRALLDAPAHGVSPVSARAFTRAAAGLVYTSQEDLSRRVLDRVEALRAEGGLDPHLEAWLDDASATRAMIEDRYDECLRSVESAAAHFARAGDLRNEWVERGYAGWACLELGLNERGEGILVDVVAASTKLGLGSTTAVAMHNLSLLIARRGAFDEAKAMGQESIRLFDVAGDTRGVGSARYYLALICDMAGDTALCEASARAAFDTVQPSMKPGALALIARCELKKGNVVEGVNLARTARVRLAEFAFAEDGRSVTALVLAEALLASGDLRGAREAASRAVRGLMARAEKITDLAMRRTFLENIPENRATVALGRQLAG